MSVIPPQHMPVTSHSIRLCHLNQCFLSCYKLVSFVSYPVSLSARAFILNLCVLQGIYRVTVERLEEWKESYKEDNGKSPPQEENSISLNEQKADREGEVDDDQPQGDPEEKGTQPPNEKHKADSEQNKTVELSKPKTLGETKEQYRLVYQDVNFVSNFLDLPTSCL